MSQEVQRRLESIREDVLARARQANRDVTLVAVSKTKPDEDLMEAYRAGQRDFGENRVQELVGKAGRLPQDIRWHMIGHIQTNKIKDFLPIVHLVHGVDRRKVLDVMEREAAKINRTVNILLQVHIAEEATKFGFDAEELRALANEDVWSSYPHLTPVGLMGMATFTDDRDLVRSEFATLAKLHREVGDFFTEVASNRNAKWGVLSMGMSGDWPLAIEEGSTMIRVGSSIFGHRNAPSDMNWPQVRQRYERWFQGWLVLAPIVGFGSTTLVKNQLYRVWKVTHGLTDGISAAELGSKGWCPGLVWGSVVRRCNGCGVHGVLCVGCPNLDLPHQ